MSVDLSILKTRIEEVSAEGREIDYRVFIPAEGSKKRGHLGMSQIGKECSRALFLSFRKFASEDIDGRKRRLFNRGDREEFYCVWLLKQCGFEVWETDGNGKQFKCSDLGGHYSGSVDGVARDRDLKLIPDIHGHPFMLEFKTYNKTRFTQLVRKGVQESDEVYYLQQVAYLGYFPEMAGTLFMAVCKDDDRIHLEWIFPAQAKHESLGRKAEHIINAEEMPLRITTVKSDWRCNLCNQGIKKICWGDAEPPRICKTCIHSEPAENKSWICKLPGHTFGEPCADHTHWKLTE